LNGGSIYEIESALKINWSEKTGKDKQERVKVKNKYRCGWCGAPTHADGSVNPNDPSDYWLVEEQFFKDNYERVCDE
jgi:hypothetical protein